MDERRRDNRKMTSIARKINLGFWLRRFFALLWLDIVIVILIIVTFLWWRTEQSSSDFWGMQAEWHISGKGYENLQLITTTSDGTRDVYYVHDFFDYVIPPACILLGIQALQLIFALFHTDDIRRKLRPLNDLAIRAEALGAMAMQNGKNSGNGSQDASAGNLEHLEQAITNVSPDAPNIRVSTGDKDLQSIEVALNNLLARMQESKRQQARFVSDASHELRTPISVIQGYVNMLDRWGKEDESVLEESIEALKHESEHMKELVEQLLFLARGDSGRNTLKPVDFDLSEVMKEVWEESMMIDETHRYVYEQGAQDMQKADTGQSEQPECNMAVMAHGDRAMMKQSIRIFVQNAAKYSSEGDTIKLAVRQEGSKVLYMIQDEGIGMRDSEVVHIFERFYRADEARSESTGGSGLGLSIAKWIVDAHDGSIDVLSRPDFGTRFTVSFPALE